MGSDILLSVMFCINNDKLRITKNERASLNTIHHVFDSAINAQDVRNLWKMKRDEVKRNT